MVPLTIPLLTGPASMSTVVIYADRAQTLAARRAGGLRRGHCPGHGRVLRWPTPSPACCKTGINVMTRLMGLILAALAVEVMTDGWARFSILIAR